MSVDLTLDSAREQRNALATRDEVLDKVKALSLLPGTTYVTAEMVANYYEVDREAVLKLAQRNRDELEVDGFAVLTGDALVDIKSTSRIETRAPSLAVFPRRAVLRVGMLLRDSEIAKRVRTYLLDAESPATVATFSIPHTYAEALRAAADQAERAEKAEAKVAELEPKADLADTFLITDGSTRLVREAAKLLGMREGDLRRLLLDEKLIFVKHAPCGVAMYDFYASYAHHFVVKENPVEHAFGLCSHYTLRITARGIELIRKRIREAASRRNDLPAVTA